jgi:hypothetical protein
VTGRFKFVHEIETANRRAGKYFFEPDTMRFFRSKVASWEVWDGRYFITSEQFKPSYGPAYRRMFTICEAHDDGHINTVGEFQGYRTLAQAKKAVKALCAEDRMPKKGQRKCCCCEQYFDAENYGNWPDGGALEPDAGILCETCYSEDETVVTVQMFYVDGSRAKLELGQFRAMLWEQDEDGNSDYDTIDEATGWTAKWHSTDGWRGYYDIGAPDGWVNVKSDAIFDLTARDLERFDARLRDFASERCVTVARVTARTSNVFSVGGDWFLECDQTKADTIMALAETEPAKED